MKTLLPQASIGSIILHPIKGKIEIVEDECNPDPCINCVFEKCGRPFEMNCSSKFRIDGISIKYIKKRTKLWHLLHPKSSSK